jgi:hypothetical protein
MLGNLKKVMKEGPDAHPEQYEGVAEEGLRMLVFGKPGSGKVSGSQVPIVRS